jgi:hypothetical protein
MSYDNSKTRPDTSGLTINISEVLTLIIHEIISHVPMFSHIDMGRVHVCMSSNRKSRGGATFGKLVPLKFKDGREALSYRGRWYAMPEVLHNGMPLLYIIYFYSPRFLDLSAFEKMRVIFHELYHISPNFNGDIRRMGKVKSSHGASRKHFDSHFEDDLVPFYKYISETPFMNFLEMDTQTLFSTFKKVYSNRMKVPRPVVIKN